MYTANYSTPVATLLTYGDCLHKKDWPDYRSELGIKQKHIPELIRMATDPSLHQADSESLEVWGPVHAWRALAQLKAVEAVEPLLSLLNDPDNNWAFFELPLVMGEIGSPALPTLGKLLSDESTRGDVLLCVVYCLTVIAEKHTYTRQACIELMIKKLEGYKSNDFSLNGYLVEALCKLKAIEALPLIEEAFLKQKVDLSVIGWDDVEDSF